jgi:hypothetical protein
LQKSENDQVIFDFNADPEIRKEFIDKIKKKQKMDNSVLSLLSQKKLNRETLFKCFFCPDALFKRNYISHLDSCAYNTEYRSKI